MNDRLKFRMYDTNVNKMWMPNDFEEVESIYECIKQQINWDLDVDYDIKFNHLEDGRFFMQCTGLKDKNGKLIYEGDIVKNNQNSLYSVEFEEFEHQTKFCLKRIENPNYYPHISTWQGIGYKDQKNYEVIGNIYENKELLEEE